MTPIRMITLKSELCELLARKTGQIARLKGGMETKLLLL